MIKRSIFFLIAILLSGCVSTVRYREVLAKAEISTTNLAIAHVDLRDLKDQQLSNLKQISDLQRQIDALTTEQYLTSRKMISERQNIGNTLASSSKELKTLQDALDLKASLIAELKLSILNTKNENEKLKDALQYNLKKLPKSQYQLSFDQHHVELKLHENLIFGQNKSVISSYGKVVLNDISNVLLRFTTYKGEIRCKAAPIDSQSLTSVKTAAHRSAVILDYLITHKGLSKDKYTLRSGYITNNLASNIPAEAYLSDHIIIRIAPLQGINDKIEAILKE